MLKPLVLRYDIPQASSLSSMLFNIFITLLEEDIWCCDAISMLKTSSHTVIIIISDYARDTIEVLIQ